MSRTRQLAAGFALSAYVWALLGAYALHGADCGHVGCAVAHTHAHQQDGDHHHHAYDHGADHEHHPSAPAPRHDGDECGWCQFLALSAWQQPAQLVAEIETAADTLPTSDWTMPDAQPVDLPPVRGPPAYAEG